MNIKNSLWAIALSSSLLLNPAIANELNSTKWEVYQLVWNKLIPTSEETMKNLKIKVIKCLEFNGNNNIKSTIYTSNEKNIIPTWFFWTLDKTELDLIKNNSTPCK